MKEVELLELAQSRRFECFDGTERTFSHWINLFEHKPILGVDFHHTISERCGACDGNSLRELSAGPPQHGVAEALEMLSKFFEIEIFTGYGASYNSEARNCLEYYLVEHGIYFDRINTTKPSFMFQVDDRGVHHRSWSETVRQIAMRSVRPRGVYK